MSESTAWADANGLRIRYAVVGDGPPVVLVHGWGSDRRGNWDATGWTERLCADHRVVTLDVRGHGESEKPLDAARYSYAAMAEDVIAVLDALDIERAGFVGYSMGAFIGAWLFGHRPERFTAMVLGGVGIESPESIARAAPIAAGLRAEDAAAIDDPVGRAVRAFVDQDPNIDADAREALAVSALQMWPEGDAVALAGPSIAEIPVPLLAVVGTRDEPYTSSVGAFVDQLADGRALMLEDEDHLGAVRSETFKAAAHAFLQQHAG